MTPKKEYTTTDTHELGHVDTSPKVQKHCWRLTVLVCQCFFCFFRFRTFFKVSRFKLSREERGNFKFQVSSFEFQVSSFKFQVSKREGGREGGRGSQSIESVTGVWSRQRRNHCRACGEKVIQDCGSSSKLERPLLTPHSAGRVAFAKEELPGVLGRCWYEEWLMAAVQKGGKVMPADRLMLHEGTFDLPSWCYREKLRDCSKCCAK